VLPLADGVIGDEALLHAVTVAASIPTLSAPKILDMSALQAPARGWLG
jgi:hypothetical protein